MTEPAGRAFTHALAAMVLLVFAGGGLVMPRVAAANPCAEPKPPSQPANPCSAPRQSKPRVPTIPPLAELARLADVSV